MLRFKAWHTAFIIAVVFHVSCFVLFNIKIVPRESNYQSGYKTATAFLGPILEDILFAPGPIRAVSSKIEYKKSAVNIDNLPMPELLPASFVPPAEFVPRNMFVDMQLDFKNFAKNIEIELIKLKPKHNFSDFSGALQSRRLIFKPANPVPPAWVKGAGRNFRVKFKIWVDYDGRVVFLDRLISSGYTDIDLIFMKYILSMRFDRLADKAAQWGLLELKF